jgi:hypothetical protein
MPTGRVDLLCLVGSSYVIQVQVGGSMREDSLTLLETFDACGESTDHIVTQNVSPFL